MPLSKKYKKKKVITRFWYTLKILTQQYNSFLCIVGNFLSVDINIKITKINGGKKHPWKSKALKWRI